MKHPVPKYKTTRSKTKRRHTAFMNRTRKKLLGTVDKLRGLEAKGYLALADKSDKGLVKKVKAS